MFCKKNSKKQIGLISISLFFCKIIDVGISTFTQTKNNRPTKIHIIQKLDIGFFKLIQKHSAENKSKSSEQCKASIKKISFNN